MNEFPTPAYGGPPYLKYLKKAKDYSGTTDFAHFEDGGMDTNEHASDTAQLYEFIYGGLTESQAKTLDDHFTVNRLAGPFTLLEPRNEPWTGAGSSVTVRYETYERPEHPLYDVQARRVVLIKTPV